jgi:hypothetical protein
MKQFMAALLGLAITASVHAQGTTTIRLFDLPAGWDSLSYGADNTYLWFLVNETQVASISASFDSTGVMTFVNPTLDDSGNSFGYAGVQIQPDNGNSPGNFGIPLLYLTSPELTTDNYYSPASQAFTPFAPVPEPSTNAFFFGGVNVSSLWDNPKAAFNSSLTWVLGAVGVLLVIGWIRSVVSRNKEYSSEVGRGRAMAARYGKK